MIGCVARVGDAATTKVVDGGIQDLLFPNTDLDIEVEVDVDASAVTTVERLAAVPPVERVPRYQLE